MSKTHFYGVKYEECFDGDTYTGIALFTASRDATSRARAWRQALLDKEDLQEATAPTSAVWVEVLAFHLAAVLSA